jgi:hypothetical protein
MTQVEGLARRWLVMGSIAAQTPMKPVFISDGRPLATVVGAIHRHIRVLFE